MITTMYLAPIAVYDQDLLTYTHDGDVMLLACFEQGWILMPRFEVQNSPINPNRVAVGLSSRPRLPPCVTLLNSVPL